MLSVFKGDLQIKKIMANPTMKIRCRGCKRKVDAIIVKEYITKTRLDLLQGDGDWTKFRKLIIKDHRKSFFKSQHCRFSGRKITKQM